MISRVQPGMLPPEAVVLQVTGPFGAPAQKVWGFETLMVVGAGIGVTPFASILRSVQLRSKQRETIMSTATRPGNEDLVVVPKKIYFYWICRGQEEFDWFCDLLSDAAEGPAAGIVDITLFLTGEVELSQAHHSLGVMGHDRFQGFFTPGEETSLCQWTVLWST
eukprot:symbB.v1.2.014519.t1/scaffold1064.1/size140376/5